MTTPRLILASGSRYRRQQLTVAGYEFEAITPNTDETSKPNELPHELAKRLAFQKAVAVLTSRPNAIVIGADQVCAFGDQSLGKPGTTEAAKAQLHLIASQVVTFHSAVAVLSANNSHQFIVPTEIAIRDLTPAEIARYVELDSPVDTAGAIKSELRGPHLFNRVTSDDPSALIGLPLIRLAATLREFGINPLSSNDPKT
ncbi:MAG: septum formation protein Maf [Pseudomonadales bacterium]|nr:septum formation protein Maf [Pseudomonadales bacterium]